MSCWKTIATRVVIVLFATTQTLGQVPPGIPKINAPSFVIENNSVTLSCSSAGGNPTPAVNWYRGSQSGVLVDQSYTTINGVTTNDYTFVANRNQHREVYECQVENGVLQEELTATWFFEVYTEPNNPTVSGQTTVILGSTNQWTCISRGGNPAPTVTWRIENIPFNRGVTQTIGAQSDNTYIVTSNLVWTPTLFNDGQTLHCDVQHSQTRGSNLQTASLLLTVHAEPNKPSLIGPSTVTFGNTNQWSCISTGGRPIPYMTLRIGNTRFTSEVTQTSTLQLDNTYTVTGTLIWAPNTTSDGQTLYCEVQHQETRGNNLQTTSLNLTVNAEPADPTLTGPKTVIFGVTNQWICISRGGNPAPVMTLRIGNSEFRSDVTQTSARQSDNTYTITSILLWAPSIENSGQNLFCDVQHQQTRGNSLQTVNLTITVNAEPNPPVLSGPTGVILGSTNVWTCISTGGKPEPLVTFRIGSSQFTTGITKSSALESDNTYTVTAVLSWAPNVTHNGQTLYCDVQHPETRGNSAQTTTLQLTVNAEPKQPTMTGPTSVTSGTTSQWTCISTGGIPAPTISLRIDNTEFTTGVTRTTTLQSDNTLTVTAVLSWAPSFASNGKRLYCDVKHQETRGSNLQTVGFQITVNVRPTQPTITGPTTVISGSTNQWSCISTGGRPAPLITFRIGNSQFTSGVTYNAVLQPDGSYTVTSLLSWTPSVANNGQIIYCDVQPQESLGSSIQTASLTLTVYDPLSISAPLRSYEATIGTQVVLNCSVTGTSTSVVWYFNNQEITIPGSTKYYNGNTVTPSLTITSVAASDAGSYYCQATNGVSTVNSSIITLSIKALEDGGGSTASIGAAKEDTSSLASGEIAAIILAVLFFILLVVLFICCCCQGFCASIIYGKKEKVTPQTSKLEIPRFYEKPKKIDERQPTVTIRSNKERQRQYRSSSPEYEINKYVVLKPADSFRLSESRQYQTDNLYVSNNGSRSYYLPTMEYTVDGEEDRKRRRRRKKRKSSSRRRLRDNVNDEEIVLEEVIQNGDTQQRSSTRENDHTSRVAEYDIVAELEPLPDNNTF